jgi:hypothetical protein
MSKLRLVQASAFVAVTSAQGAVYCRHEETHSTDFGCSDNAPFCVSAEGHPSEEVGVKCVPCLNYHQHPTEPDWGCPPDQPLCVTDDGSRPELKSAGAKCAPYPCTNTKKEGIDQGCTESHPTCVDALGNDPLPGQVGIECVAYKELVAEQVKSCDCGVEQSCTCGKPHLKWGVANERQPCLITGATEPPAFSLCTGCPFGISKKCGLSGKLGW